MRKLICVDGSGSTGIVYGADPIYIYLFVCFIRFGEPKRCSGSAVFVCKLEQPAG